LAFAVVLRELAGLAVLFRAPDAFGPEELRAAELRAAELRPDELPLDLLPLDLLPLDLLLLDLLPLDEPRADEPLRFRVEPPVARSLSFESSSSSWSEPISFLATPTAAGIATPSAVPATTFCVVDRPSSSFDMVTSEGPRLSGVPSIERR